MNSNDTSVYLPRVVFKNELAAYFGVTTRYLWRVLLKKELFDAWGFKKSDYAYKKRFPPQITKRIYLHFEITNLNTTMLEEIKAIESPENGHRAPSED